MNMQETQAAAGELSRALIMEIAEQRRLHPEVTQNVIAAAIGKTQVTVVHRISGRYAWTASELDALAPLFNMNAFQLIESARRHVGTPSLTPLDPQQMTTAQLESLPHAATTPRKKPN